MDRIQGVVLSLECALPELQFVWEWWTESTRSPFEMVKVVSTSFSTCAHEDLGGASLMDTCGRPRHIHFCDTLDKI